jgi:transposase
LQKLFADSAYQGPIFREALSSILPELEIEIVKRSDAIKGFVTLPIFREALSSILPELEIEIVKRSDAIKGFVTLPKRWIVERTIGWLNRCRRLAKDWENQNQKALAFLKWASVRLMIRKLCNAL